MKAQLKSGKVITGKLAETLNRLGISKEVSEKKKGRKPKEVETETEVKE